MSLRRWVPALLVAASVAGLSGCPGGPDNPSQRPLDAPHSSVDSDPTPPTPPATTISPTRPPARPVTIAFAGDVHFAGQLAGGLRDPATAMGPLARRLARADLAIVNLETAVTTRGRPQPKEYVFRAPPAAFRALRDAGIDVVTMANNHALDYGPAGVPDARAAAGRAGVPVIGLGRNSAAAYRPWVASLHGQRIAFFGATAVLDSGLVDSWSAGPHQPGVATALDGHNAALVAAVKAVRPHVDTVVVDMHYGSDLMSCPTSIQRTVVRDVVRAGADIVVGQHAHVLLGAGYRGAAYVDYGLGNFEFYSASGPTAETGVLQLTVAGRSITSPRWFPGRIEGGTPIPLRGSAARQAVTSHAQLRSCTGLRAVPSG